MKCIIFQNKIEIDHFKEKFNILDFKIIAWNSEVVDELEKLKLDYICAGSIYKKKFDVTARLNLINQYGKINHLLDKIVLKNIPIFKKKNIKPFDCIASLNRNFFLSYIMDIEIIFYLKKNFNFRHVYYYEHLVEGYSGLLSKVIRLYTDKNKNYFQKLKISLDKKSIFKEYYGKFYLENKIKSNFIYILLNNLKIILKRFLKYDDLKNHIYTFSTNFFNFLNNKENILLFTDFNYFNEYKKELIIKKFNLIYWNDFFFNIKRKIINFNFKKIYKDIDNSKILKKNCTYRSLCFYKLISKDLKILIKDIVPKLWDNYVFYKSVDQKYKFKFIISEYNSPTLEMILNKKNNITPIFIELHGGSVGMYNAQPFQHDFNRVGGNLLNYFYYTNEIKKQQRKNFKNTKNLANYHSVGSIYHEKLYNKLNSKKYFKNNNKINICLVVTQFAKIGDNAIGIYREVNTYKLLKSVLDLFEKNSNSKFNFYLKCGYDIESRNLDILKSYKKTKILSSNFEVTKILNLCDIFILPSFSSFFFDISCSKKKILINLDKRVHSFTKGAQSKINKRADISFNENVFLNKIKDILKNPNKSKFIINSKNNDLTFYKSYCNDSSNIIRNRLKFLQNND